MLSNPFAAHQSHAAYRWVMLILCSLTALTVVTLPNMSLPPMFATISQDLGLSLVEIGVVWGVASFTGIFFALIGGTLGDRFGSRTTLFLACLLTGVFGLMRSFTVDFTTLLLAALFLGIFQAVIPVLLFKVAHHWFPPQQLGMASGVISAGFAGGLMLGPLLSTSVILPAFGGWRQVLVFYGGIAVLMSLIWLVLHPVEKPSASAQVPRVSLGQSLRHVTRQRDIWILGIGGLGISACFQGFSGYLPTYLKTIGWPDLDADRALAAFFLSSLIAVIPLSILSDRLRLRRGFLIFGALVIATGIGLLSVVDSALIVLVISITGLVFDSFMAVMNASALEVEGVSALYAGTAVGFPLMIRNLGGTFSPAVGNSLAGIAPNIPFVFWGGMGLFAVLMFAVFLKPRRVAAPENAPLDPIEMSG
jgi:nitrate/nitrite transporter NarK